MENELLEWELEVCTNYKPTAKNKDLRQEPSSPMIS